MTANQAKRIRTRLENAAKLVQEAYDLAESFATGSSQDDRQLRDIAARAADSGMDCVQALERYDESMRMHARRTAASNAPFKSGDRVASEPYKDHPQVVGTIRSITPLRNAIILYAR